MCKEIIAKTKFICGDGLDQPGFKVPWENCGGCGQVRSTEYLGQTTKKEPCDDCKDNKKWIQNSSGVWVKS
ncbi:hypothetical protein H9L39_18787 [Fusarium oxysporum f. sp. albedinis]|nr:hypothetical protein H9L39_18787 [Fusarium oxysporum f. sp. albedinis]